jgi:hypothetical protein
MAIDDGHAVDYTAVTPGTPVYSSDEVELGTIARVLDNERERIFDGVVMSTAAGERFVDAPEVARTAERAVTLNITSEEAQRLGPPEKAPSPLRPPDAGGGGGLLARLFGGRRR